MNLTLVTDDRPKVRYHWELPLAERSTWYAGAWIEDGMRLRRGDKTVVANVLPKTWPGGSESIRLTYLDGTNGTWSRADVATNSWQPVLG